jgi:CspA family cold shock protein
MPTGTVKWFNPTKGFGFVQPDTGGKDIFVHISAVQRAGMQTLKEGQNVTYEIQTQKDGRQSAEKLGRRRLTFHVLRFRRPRPPGRGRFYFRVHLT